MNFAFFHSEYSCKITIHAVSYFGIMRLESRFWKNYQKLNATAVRIHIQDTPSSEISDIEATESKRYFVY